MHLENQIVYTVVCSSKYSSLRVLYILIAAVILTSFWIIQV